MDMHSVSTFSVEFIFEDWVRWEDIQTRRLHSPLCPMFRYLKQTRINSELPWHLKARECHLLRKILLHLVDDCTKETTINLNASVMKYWNELETKKKNRKYPWVNSTFGPHTEWWPRYGCPKRSPTLFAFNSGAENRIYWNFGCLWF